MFGHLDLDFKKNNKTFKINRNTINELMISINKLRNNSMIIGFM